MYPVCLNFKVRDGCDVGRWIDMILTLLDKFLFSIFNFLNNNNKKKFKSKSICFLAKQKYKYQAFLTSGLCMLA